MKSLYVVGNWKSNKTSEEASAWWGEFAARVKRDSQVISAAKKTALTMVLSVPYTLLSVLKSKISSVGFPLYLGAQDVSPFSEGAYTGEVSARMVKELADYVIIGHSERRRYFQETDEELEFETLQAAAAELTAIYCVEGVHNNIPASAAIVAYEPPSAIGKGQAEDVEKAAVVCQEIKTKTHKSILYGGSVTADNVTAFFAHPAIDGVLLGGASLDPDKFYQVVRIAAAH